MKATTVKVEGALLKELERAKPPEQSISAYVRTILEQEMRRRRMAQAGERYAQFVRDSSDERAWLTEWESADLEKPPARGRR
jgi:hypothetical protein